MQISNKKIKNKSKTSTKQLFPRLSLVSLAYLFLFPLPLAPFCDQTVEEIHPTCLCKYIYVQIQLRYMNMFICCLISFPLLPPFCNQIMNMFLSPHLLYNESLVK